uniref:Uncharacterized protein n=1 Tax=Rhizophora mucronata TaxID=61149 RepID=A0A2P2JEB0_RHIMU
MIIHINAIMRHYYLCKFFILSQENILNVMFVCSWDDIIKFGIICILNIGGSIAALGT